MTMKQTQRSPGIKTIQFYAKHAHIQFLLSWIKIMHAYQLMLILINHYCSKRVCKDLFMIFSHISQSGFFQNAVLHNLADKHKGNFACDYIEFFADVNEF